MFLPVTSAILCDPLHFIDDFDEHFSRCIFRSTIAYQEMNIILGDKMLKSRKKMLLQLCQSNSSKIMTPQNNMKSAYALLEILGIEEHVTIDVTQKSKPEIFTKKSNFAKLADIMTQTKNPPTRWKSNYRSKQKQLEEPA